MSTSDGRPAPATAARALARRLGAGDPLVALLAKIPCAAQVEAAGHAGFDLVVVDTEHGPGDALELEHHVRAAQAVGLAVLVRVPSASPPAILAALDAGATGVVVPHVVDAAGAEAVVAAAHYPPRGRRGLATSTRAGGYGAVPLAEHLRRAAEETCVVVQVEDAEAVPLAGEILAVPGVSGVLIGANDLSVSLGHPGALSYPDVEAAIGAIYAAGARTGTPVLAVVGSEPDAVTACERGAAVLVSVATTLVHGAFLAAVATARRARGAAQVGD